MKGEPKHLRYCYPMSEWLANGARDEDPGGLWFALREDAWMPPGS